jgi:hypothetical protein
MKDVKVVDRFQFLNTTEARIPFRLLRHETHFLLDYVSWMLLQRTAVREVIRILDDYSALQRNSKNPPNRRENTFEDNMRVDIDHLFL